MLEPIHVMMYRDTSMNLPAEISNHLDELRVLAVDCGIRSVSIIGSACTDAFDPIRSDLDLLVDFGDYTDDLGARMLRFSADTQRIFGRHVDVMSQHGIRNKTWQAIHEACQVPVYAAA
jgi:hypothetical protein